ncbi:hypothetical protein G7Y89_g11189 [Cudoniella acicularis]|uniref:Uncharacterized protein n=1 Tax=Cudoniella acicularis TaxID=354080 RepID=A0A8H4VY29_9HELO|nr:hypothetical protein G7Y89_g11189 [Cudoniella acicularis]
MYDDGTDLALPASKKEGMIFKALRNSSSDSKIEEDSPQYEAWLQLFCDYQNRRLSFEQDKLVANAGLAAVFGRLRRPISGGVVEREPGSGAFLDSRRRENFTSKFRI